MQIILQIPKAAYIDAFDYATPKDLANYLLHLNSNPNLYNQYFKWKKNIKIQSNSLSISPICDMCIKLHLETYLNIDNSRRENVEENWRAETNCKIPKPNETSFFNFT